MWPRYGIRIGPLLALPCCLSGQVAPGIGNRWIEAPELNAWALLLGGLALLALGKFARSSVRKRQTGRRRAMRAVTRSR